MILSQLPEWVPDITAVCGLLLAIAAVAKVITNTVLGAVHGLTNEMDDRIKEHLEPISSDMAEHKDFCAQEFDFIRGELSYNGGKSTKDLVLSNNEKVAKIEKALEEGGSYEPSAT